MCVGKLRAVSGRCRLIGRTLGRFDLSSSHGVFTRVGIVSKSGTKPLAPNWLLFDVTDDRFDAGLADESRVPALLVEVVVATEAMLSFATSLGIDTIGLKHVSDRFASKSNRDCCC